MKPTKQVFSFLGKSINIKKEKLKSNKIKMLFRKSEKDFTRNRKLTFENMIALILQKGVKSLQLRLNEFSSRLSNKLETITVSAYVQAKNKISYKVFLHLNLSIIINRYYDLKENEAGYETWNKFRILAIDGSQIRLPDEKEIKEKYGTSKIKNPKGDQGEYTHGLLSVLYDALNNLAIDSILEKGKYSERALAIQNIINLEKTIKIKEKDLILYDRGYFSNFFCGVLYGYNKDFVLRVRRGISKEADELFNKNNRIDTKIIRLKVNNQKKEYENKYGIKINTKIKNEIDIRLVRVILSTGEIEVLATSLLDEVEYKTEIFKELYFKRWGIEVYYNILKNRLGLENFTGKNIESVLQDLHSSIYLSNFETIATRGHNMELELKINKKKLRNKQKVNKQVSFNVIKNRVMDLFLNDRDTDEIIKELNVLFNTNVTQVRIGRSSYRSKTTVNKSLQFQRRKKKSCF